LPSRKLIILLPNTLSFNMSAMGMGYSSFGVILFKSLKSTQIQIFPVFFSTGTMFDTHSVYLHGLIKPARRSRSTSSFTLPTISGLKLLIACL
jgi:hypothetical protein